MSAIVPVASVSAVSAAAARPPSDRPDGPAVPSARAVHPVKQVQPIRFYGGIDGMNATQLIVALQSNGTTTGGYSARAIETGGTPPPAIIDRGA